MRSPRCQELRLPDVPTLNHLFAVHTVCASRMKMVSEKGTTIHVDGPSLGEGAMG